MGVEAEQRDERVALDLEVSPDEVSSIVTAWMLAVAAHGADLCGVQMRTAPSPSSARASLTEDSRRGRSRRWTSVIGRFAVSCRPSVQSSAESPPPTITQVLSLKTSLRRTK